MRRDESSRHITPIKSSTLSAAQQSTRRLVDQCRRLVLDSLAQELDQALSLVDDTLFAQAEKAHSNVEQTLYFDTMRDIRRNRSAITRAFHSRLSKTFRRFPPGPPQVQTNAEEPELDEDSMTLLNTEAYEDTLQVTNLSNRVQARCHEALFGLEKRLAFLNDGHPLQEQDNPFAPRYIAESLALAIEPANLHNRIKPDLYRLFEETVMNRLDSIYQTINALLVENKILPNLRYKATIKNEQVTPRPKQAAGTTQEDINQVSMSQLLQQFHQQTRTESQPGATWSRNQLIDALTRLQKQALQGSYQPFTGSKGASAFRTALMAELKQGGKEKKQLSQGDQSNLLMVEQIFERVSRDNQLPEAYQALLPQLALPWAQLALSDRTLFNEQPHPAKELLDAIARAADQFRDAHMLSRDLLKQSQLIIDALIREPQLRKHHVHSLLEDFQQHLGQLYRKADMLEQRQIEASKGQEILHNAHLWAKQILQQAGNNLPLPAFSQLFFSTLWIDTLVFHYLRHHDQASRDVIENLTKMLITAITGRDSETFLSLSPQLSESLKQPGSYPDTTISHIITELAREAAGQPGDTSQLEQLNQQRLHRDNTEQATNNFVPPATEAIISTLQPGLWCNAVNSQNKSRRWKLAWQSQKSQLFLFVDGAGQKTALIDRGTLGNWIMQGRLTPLAENLPPLLKRALLAIQNRLRPNSPS